MLKKLLNTLTGKKKPKLVYRFDPYCGWCYGFSPVMAQIYNEYKETVDFDVLSCGLYIRGRAGTVNEAAPYIRDGKYKEVEKYTGVEFGKPFLDNINGPGDIVFNSHTPTIAFSIIKEKFPDQVVPFASILLKMVYQDGIDPTNHEHLFEEAKKVGYTDKADFLNKMKDQKYTILANEEFINFAKIAQLGMPTLVLYKDGKEHVLSKGYMPYNDIKKVIKLYLGY